MLNMFRESRERLVFVGDEKDIDLLVFLYHAYLRWEYRHNPPVICLPDKYIGLEMPPLDHLISESEKASLYPKRQHDCSRES